MQTSGNRAACKSLQESLSKVPADDLVVGELKAVELLMKTGKWASSIDQTFPGRPMFEVNLKSIIARDQLSSHQLIIIRQVYEKVLRALLRLKKIYLCGVQDNKGITYDGQTYDMSQHDSTLISNCLVSYFGKFNILKKCKFGILGADYKNELALRCMMLIDLINNICPLPSASTKSRTSTSIPIPIQTPTPTPTPTVDRVVHSSYRASWMQNLGHHGAYIGYDGVWDINRG